MAFTVCPKCHFDEPSTTACSRCGTVFDQWYSMHVPHPAAPKPNPALGEALRLLERQRVIDEFQWRRKRLLFIVVAFGLVSLGLILGYAVTHNPIVGVLAAIILVTGIRVSFSAWTRDYRCPACDALVTSLNPARCKCGAPLRRGTPASCRPVTSS
jgi:hypothetical protein